MIAMILAIFVRLTMVQANGPYWCNSYAAGAPAPPQKGAYFHNSMKINKKD
jgi:hypothetical protein